MGLLEDFRSLVIPALTEYSLAEAEVSCGIPEAEKAVLRRARTAAIELHQFAERVFHTAPEWLPNVRDENKFREWLGREIAPERCNDFALLGDVADGFKHFELRRQTAQINGSESVVLRSIPYGSGAYGAGKYGGNDQIVVELNDGTLRPASTIMLSVCNVWLKLFGQASIRSLSDLQWKRPEDCSSGLSVVRVSHS